MGFLTWKIQDGVQFQHPRGRNLISYYLAAISVDVMNADQLPPWIRQKCFLFNHSITFLNFFSCFEMHLYQDNSKIATSLSQSFSNPTGWQQGASGNLFETPKIKQF